MNGTQLGDEIIVAINSVTGGAATGQVKLIWEAIGRAIVDHIKNNAVVSQPPDSDGSGEQPGSVT
jgi:ribosomal protein S9